MTQAEARNKGGNASTLGIQFDKAMLKDGTEIALNVVIQAMAPREFSGPVGGGDDSSPQHIGTSQTSPMAGRAPVPNSAPPTAEEERRRRGIFRLRRACDWMHGVRGRWG